MANETQELVTILEQNAEKLRLQWIRLMNETRLLAALSPKEIEEQSKAIYDACVQCLKTGEYSAAEKYAQSMAKRAVLSAMTVDQIIAGLLILRDVYGKFIFDLYHDKPQKWESTTGVYEPVARRILNIAALAFVNEKEAVIKQQEAVMRLSTPVVETWEGIVTLPVIGTLDSARARQLTETILNYIGQAKAHIVVVDISGIAAIDTKAASHILRTMQAVRLMGSDVIITGIRPDVATTLVALGVDMTSIQTRSSLREGLEYAYSVLGLKVTKIEKP
jgi:rsbT co-antagonist protein RsbR